MHQPFWFDPVDVGGDANMLGAFSYAKALVQKWISDNPEYPAPVIINFSDGVPYYDGKDSRECMKETAGMAKEIMSLSTEDGNVLIYNIQVDGNLTGAELFPSDRNKLAQEGTKFLFDISSEVPESCLETVPKSYADEKIIHQLLRQGARVLSNEISLLFPVFSLS